MQAPESLIRAVKAVLKRKARDGKTTKRDAALEVLGKIENVGGPTKFGIGAGALRWALRQIVEAEITRQLKMGLTDHEYKFVMPASTPMEIVAAIGKVPRWIAISDGTEAEWVPTLQASPKDWFLNGELKHKKSRQTEASGNTSIDIGRFLKMNGFNSLEEAMKKGRI
jgi:hypothetical protein